MPKLISDQVRQRVIEIASRHGFVVQSKDGLQDQYVKNLMLYCKSLNQTVYIRKDRAVGDGGIPAYFHVAVHPNFFNKAWVSVPEGIEELINQQKKKNLHSSSNYQKFPVYPENDEPCGMSFKVTGYDALGKLFQQMVTGNKMLDPSSEPTASSSSETDTVFALDEKRGFPEKSIAAVEPRKQIGKLVSDRLEQVHKGLGEMQTLAVGVGDLKKVLSNVKTRGILGEYQLGNILEQILSPEQYSVNVATKQGSRENVEYAVKLPGKSDEKTVWLPIDSKFPLESYQALLNALEEGNPVTIDAAQKILLKAVEGFAKDISTKYIDPPNTTDFAIMFLPVESLYAEVLRHPEMFERLQRTYRVTITGPTTLSALLNSLNMGFRTLAVQKRSSEVWKVLAEVKTEFVKYSEQLATVHKHLNTATTSLEKLQTTRTNAMARKLNSVDGLEFEQDGTPTLPEGLPGIFNCKTPPRCLIKLFCSSLNSMTFIPAKFNSMTVCSR
jgi:hypothetical protein